MGARIFIPLDAELIYFASCGIDIHASPSQFQGDFDRVTIDQLILLFTSLTFFSTDGIKNGRNFVAAIMIYIRFVSLTLHDLSF